uniref:RNA binding motif protein 44 n=1 Tax=Nothoprocta perdicaria TaxID=30464 RepID=A0A8C6ZF36_NOTPE
MELGKNVGIENKTELFIQTSHLLSYSEKVEHTVITDLAAEVNCSGFGQACSINVSELQLSEGSLPYLASSLDADLEMCNEERATVCCACGCKREKEAGMPGGACNDMHFIYRAGDDYRQGDLSEDSQLEYVSGDEQEYYERNSSSEFCKPMKTVGIKASQLLDTVHEVPGSGARKEHDLVNMLEGCSTCKYCIGAAVSDLPQELQDCLSLPVCKDLSCDCEEEQTEYHSVLSENTLESRTCGSRERSYPNVSVNDILENEEVKDSSSVVGTQLTRMAINEKTVEKKDIRVQSIAVKQEGFPAVATQLCRSAGETNPHRCDESITCAVGTSCVRCAWQGAETQCPVLEINARENPSFDLEVVDIPSGNVRYLNPELERCANLESATSDCKVTINQTVDASSDFRACFTTSRATSAQACLVSRAVNTGITMMNKSRPVEWRREICADVACNTDWSWVSDSREETWPQFADVLGKHLEGNTATAETSQIQKQSVKDSIYCRKLLWRAIQAELQVLNMHYQMCCHHCYEINKLMLEEEKELNASLLLVLEELKKSYETMKKKIEMGVPLNALPSLSVETRLFTLFSSYVPGKVIFNFFFVLYAFLCFNDANKAKLAVEEMNGKEIKGKTVSVELVKNASGNRASVFQSLLTKFWYEIQSINTQNSGQDKTFPLASNSVKNSMQKTSALYFSDSLDTFIPPNTLNLSSFTKLMKKLQEIHPETSREKIIDALLQVRTNNKGILSGLSINSIVKRTSLILRKSMSKSGGKKE